MLSRQQVIDAYAPWDAREDAVLNWTDAEISFDIDLAEVEAKNDAAFTEWAGGDDHTAIRNLMWAVDFIVKVFNDLTVPTWGSPSGFLPLDNTYIGMYWPELTAGKIMEAWIDAKVSERMMTVLTLDELRREVWSQEFFSFRIAPAEPG